MGLTLSKNLTVTDLLSAVENNNKSLVKRICKSRPDLITQKETFTLISGQQFNAISPVQLAAWSLNGSLTYYFADFAIKQNYASPNAHDVYEEIQALTVQGHEHGARYDYENQVPTAYENVGQHFTYPLKSIKGPLVEKDDKNSRTDKKHLAEVQRTMPKRSDFTSQAKTQN